MLSRAGTTLGRAIAVIGGVASLFVVTFVLYAHVASSRDMQRMLAEPRKTSFLSKASLARDYRAIDGGASYDVDHETLAIHSAPSGASSVQLVGSEARLVESRLRMRFDVGDAARVAIAVGARTTGQTEHALSLELTKDPETCTLRLIGDRSVMGPTERGDRVIATATLPAMACAAGWHDVELRFCPQLARVIASVDDDVIFTPFVQWDTGTTLQPSFGTWFEPSEKPALVRIAEVDWLPVPVDLAQYDVDETFAGKLIDPLWRITRGDAARVDASMRSGAGGLAISGRGLTEAPNTVAYELATPTFPLGSFRASAEVDVAELSHGTFHLQIQNEPGPAWRFAEVGFLSVGDGVLVPFDSGHFDDDGRSRFRAFPDAAHAMGRVTITLDYDAAARRMRSAFCGRPFADEHVDLPPRSLSTLSFGANVDGRGAVNLHVAHASIDHAD